MTSNELISFLRSEGFSAGDTLSIIAWFVTDINILTVETLRKNLVTMKQALANRKNMEEAILNSLWRRQDG